MHVRPHQRVPAQTSVVLLFLHSFFLLFPRYLSSFFLLLIFVLLLCTGVVGHVVHISRPVRYTSAVAGGDCIHDPGYCATWMTHNIIRDLLQYILIGQSPFKKSSASIEQCMPVCTAAHTTPLSLAVVPGTSHHLEHKASGTLHPLAALCYRSAPPPSFLEGGGMPCDGCKRYMGERLYVRCTSVRCFTVCFVNF